MNKVYVKVDYQILIGGTIRPIRIHWNDDRTWEIKKVLHSCSSTYDYEGIRYTILIGSAERYLYRVDDKWYVEAIQTEVDTG